LGTLGNLGHGVAYGGNKISYVSLKFEFTNCNQGPHSDFAGPTSGSTACVAVIRNNQLVVANAGDSRCVISRKGQVTYPAEIHGTLIMHIIHRQIHARDTYKHKILFHLYKHYIWECLRLNLAAQSY